MEQKRRKKLDEKYRKEIISLAENQTTSSMNSREIDKLRYPKQISKRKIRKTRKNRESFLFNKKKKNGEILPNNAEKRNR